MHIKTPKFWNKKHSLVSYLLLPFSWIYYTISRIRPFITKPTKVSVPVVCIGNITAGGSGKTPVAIAIAKLLQSQNKTVHFLTRGYGGNIKTPTLVNPDMHTAQNVGDEPLLLTRTAPTWVARDRIAGANEAIAKGADIIVMDDGLQNPTLYKDVKILVVDGKYGLGNGRLIPAGALREKPTDCNADVAVCVGDFSDKLKEQLNMEIISATIIPDSIIPQKVVAFAGIGHPEKFFNTLESVGVNIIERIEFPDHYPYTKADIEKLQTVASKHNARLITTEKDFVRLPDTRNILTLPITAQLDEQKLLALFKHL